MTDDVRAVYEQFRARHGNSAQRLGWNDTSDQQSNFKVVLDMLPPLTGLSVHDAGCGHGDLLDAINARGGCGSYIGTDFVAATVQAAQQRHPETTFRLLDLAHQELPKVDVTLCFGAFAFHRPRRVAKMLEKMLAASRVGVGFITWWDLTPEYEYAEDAEQLRKCVRRVLKGSGCKVQERIGDYNVPLEAAFVVTR